MRVVAIPGQQLAHLRPVLLLDVRVVVLLVGPSARELNVLLFAPTLQMPVDELTAVVRIHAQQREGQHRGDLI